MNKKMLVLRASLLPARAPFRFSHASFFFQNGCGPIMRAVKEALIQRSIACARHNSFLTAPTACHITVCLSSATGAMPLFSSTSNVHINGGAFYKIGRDFNVQSIRLPGVDEILEGLEFGIDQESDRRLEGPERTANRSGARMLPYDTSHRRQVTSQPHQEGQHTSSGTALAAISLPYPFPAPSQHGAPFRPSEQLPPLKYPLECHVHGAGSSTPVINGHLARESHSTRLGPRSHLPAGAQPNAASSPMVDNNLVFPWNRPPDAPATIIDGGTFFSGNINKIQHHGEAGFHILSRAIASDALHDSAERFPQPQCHPDTRTRMLDVLCNWAHGIEPPEKRTSHDPVDPDASDDDESLPPQDGEPSSPILWLYGPAGSGKSAIAQSLCQKLNAEDRLGGAFFFKRGHLSRGNASKLFPTIAYQLARLLPEFKQFVSQIIEDDPAIVARSLSAQLQQLIINPCQKSYLSRPVSVIIDGLDECEGDDIQEEILRSIGNATRREVLPILFFISSRPESHICEVFEDPSLTQSHRPLNIEQSFQDVRKYLLDQFARIHAEHRTMAMVPSPWPPFEVVEQLVQKSSGYFIYASTVIKFVDDKRFKPVDRLNIVLGIKDSISGSPFDNLDQLYHHILSGVPVEFRPQLVGWLAVNAGGIYNELTIPDAERLLELEPGGLRLMLRGLNSLLDIPPPEDALNFPSVHHASFPDFLANPSRSGPFYVGSPEVRSRLAYQMLKAFSYTYDMPLLKPEEVPAWGLIVDGFKYITSAEPTPNLLQLVQSINPIFFFGYRYRESEEATQFTKWLKTFNPPPEGCIRLWENYTFMLRCCEAWSSHPPLQEQHSNCDNIWPLLSPQLIKILQVCGLGAGTLKEGCNLMRIHYLLDMSWEELGAAICPLREIVGSDWALLSGLVHSNKTLLVQREQSPFLLGLAMGALRAAALPLEAYPHCVVTEGCGLILRGCPPSDDLLQALSELKTVAMTISDLKNIVQWLKVAFFPQFLLWGYPLIRLSNNFRIPRTGVGMNAGGSFACDRGIDALHLTGLKRGDGRSPLLLRFEHRIMKWPNVGQSDARVKYANTNRGGILYVMPTTRFEPPLFRSPFLEGVGVAAYTLGLKHYVEDAANFEVQETRSTNQGLTEVTSKRRDGCRVGAVGSIDSSVPE
ncbi:hypothetical protein C8J57DRAFT_1482220 [Mycena rebaudengoi]|nr:hypothetical protein C8J57DRAFT_1482220 [Mycena rebaudengoi]